MEQIKLKEKVEASPPPQIPCQHCGGPTRLVGSEAHPVRDNLELVTYYCTDCDEFTVLPMESPPNTAGRSPVQHSWIQQLSQEVEHPHCAKCGVPMWLTRIEPYEPDHDRRTFECQACGNSEFEIIKLR